MVCDSREMANNWLGHHGCCQLLAAICVEVVISFCGQTFLVERHIICPPVTVMVQM